MLNERLSAYLNYFEDLAVQPPNRWDGFYLTQHENRNFALRVQIAFASYALAVLALHPDADAHERARCHVAMEQLLERMIQRRVWAFSAIEAERHGLNTDPISRGNVPYSGHLTMMIGAFEAAFSDYRYDDTFTFLWTNDEQFAYSHHSIAYGLFEQMDANPHHGIDSEPGRTHMVHMNPVLWAFALHDGLHDSEYMLVYDQWLEFVQRRMLLHGPRIQGRGVFSSLYMSGPRMPVSTGFNFVDAYTLAFLAPLKPELTEQLVPRFLKAIRRNLGKSSQSEAFVPSSSTWRSMEVSDEAVTTGFACLLATHLENHSLATELLNYADNQLLPVERDGKRYYNGGLAEPFTTALFAISEAGGFAALRDIASGAKKPGPMPKPEDLKKEEEEEKTEAEENVGGESDETA